MKVVFLLTFFLSGASSANVNAESQCNSRRPLTAADMNSAEDLVHYLKKNKQIKTVDDFVCCLPKEYQKNYIIGMSSIAGQNGTPDSPRIIMFDRTDNLKSDTRTSFTQPPPKFMISFNGGKSHNTQPHSIEIAQFNKKKKELEFFDLSFEKSGPSLSEPNPTLCMSCHGDGGRSHYANGMGPVGGPKYIFDSFPHWPRFVGGVECVSPENLLHNKLADKAISVVQTESRYRCLDKAVLKIDKNSTVPGERYYNLLENIRSFEKSNLPQEKNRQSKWLRSLPEFKKYKYFLIGYDYCSSEDSKESSELSEWFPDTELKRLYDKINIDSRLKAPGSLRLNFSKALQEEWQKNLDKRSAQEKEAESPNYSKAFVPNDSSMACSDKIFRVPFSESSNVNYYEANILILNQMDHVLNQVHGIVGGFDPRFRLFLDGEGYGTGMISTGVVNSNSKLVRSFATISISNEAASSKLKGLFRKISESERQKFDSTELLQEQNHVYFPVGGKDRVCAELKKLSMNQFNNSTVSSRKDLHKEKKEGVH